MAQWNTFSWIMVFALGAMTVNSFGIWIVYKNKALADKSKEYVICFAAGVLIASPLIMALPEALNKNPNAGIAALGGFLFMYFVNKTIKFTTNQKELAFGITALVGIGIHSFIDGIVYTVTFSVSTIVGMLAGTGLVVHEFAEGIITYTVLSKSGIAGKKAIVYAFLTAALTTPVGALVAYPVIHGIDDTLLGGALGAVGGVLVYLSASHLLPEAGEYEKKHSLAAFLCGVALAVFTMLSGSS
jgi:zinc transporter ZupT